MGCLLAAIHCTKEMTFFSPVIMYIQARTYLCTIYLNVKTTERDRLWKQRFKDLSIHPSNYKFHILNQTKAVYLKIHITRLPFYIGCTCSSMVDRENSRKRKLRQIMQGKLVNAEPALRWWATIGEKGDSSRHIPSEYFDWCTIQLSHPEDSLRGFTEEKRLIEEWQPTLNLPRVTELYNKASGRAAQKLIPIPTTKMTSTGRKMWQKVRKKLAHSNTQFMPLPKSSRAAVTPSDRSNAWNTIFEVASLTVRSYNMCRQLRQPRIPARQIYALIRSANQLEQPFKTRAMTLLTKVVKYKHGHKPSHNHPLMIPVLKHQNFNKEVKQWINQLVRDNPNNITPMHVPGNQIRQRQHQKLMDSLHSWKQWSKRWTAGEEPVCKCNAFLKKFPNTNQVDGHVAGGAESIGPIGKDLHRILAGSMKDCFYMAKTKYLEVTDLEIRKWLKNHGMPSEAAHLWRAFVETQWPIHLQAIEETDAVEWSTVQHLKQILEPLVAHCEDHAATKLCIFCPKIYHQTLMNTFNNTEVFRTVPTGQAELRLRLPGMVPESIRSRYAWGLDPNTELPKCYIFPKAKKNYLKARPVITFDKTYARTISQALSTILTQMCKIAYPENLHKDSTQSTFRKLHDFMKDLPTLTDQWKFHNDDLVGFFTSVPHDRIKAAVNHMISEYLRNHPSPQPLETTKFSVRTLEDSLSNDLRTFRGKVRRPGVMLREIWLGDIVALTELMLELSFFTSLGVCYSQIRGACIGAPASPVICNITAAFEEFVWIKAFNLTWASTTRFPAFFSRYVDNRACIIHSSDMTRATTQLISLDFYRPPVQLEEVEGNMFLGFAVDLSTRTVSYVPPSEAWQFRSPNSAGTSTLLLGSLCSRLHIIFRGTFPKSNAKKAAGLLCQQYVEKGFSSIAVFRLMNKIERQMSRRR